MNPDLYDLLEAALDRVLPSSDGPGARDARAIRFAVWYITEGPYQKWREKIERGLRLLDSVATAIHGVPFVRCAAVERDAVIRALSVIPHRSAQRFMRLLVSLAIRGFLSDPRYGGNHGEAGWRFIGLARFPQTAGARTHGAAIPNPQNAPERRCPDHR